MLIDVLTVAVFVFFLTRIVSALRQSATAPAARRHWLEIVRGLRVRHFLPAPFVLAAIMAAATALIEVPGLDFGWWTAIGGVGNPVMGSSDRTVGTPLEWLVPLVFLTLLLPVLPLFAEREEQLFRLGAENQSSGRRAWRCIQFGLVHAVVGIPIGVALALSIGGAYFMACYLRAYRIEEARSADRQRVHGATTITRPAVVEARRAALAEATRAHLAYNLLIVASVLLWIVAWLLLA